MVTFPPWEFYIFVMFTPTVFVRVAVVVDYQPILLTAGKAKITFLYQKLLW